MAFSGARTKIEIAARASSEQQCAQSIEGTASYGIFHIRPDGSSRFHWTNHQHRIQPHRLPFRPHLQPSSSPHRARQPHRRHDTFSSTKPTLSKSRVRHRQLVAQLDNANHHLSHTPTTYLSTMGMSHLAIAHFQRRSTYCADTRIRTGL